jgi:uncharacterized protein YjbI with pentapeptide repeats
MSRLNMPGVIRLTNRDGILLHKSYALTLKEALSEAVGKGIILENLDISYQDLSFLNCDDGAFSNVSFKGCNLIGANLSEANLSNCDFTECSLTGACFAYSRINCCDFYNAELSACDFSSAYLYKVNFSGAGMFNVDFTSTENIIDSYLYNNDHSEKMLLSRSSIRVAANNKRCIIQDNALYMNGEILQISTGLSGDLLHRLSLEYQGFLHA